MTRTISIILAMFVMASASTAIADAVHVRVIDAGGNPVQCVAEVSPAPPPPGSPPATATVVIDPATPHQTVTIILPRQDLTTAISALRIISGIGGKP